MGGHQGWRPAADGIAGVGAVHDSGFDASGAALALGGDRWSAGARGRTVGVSAADREAVSGADLRIISGIFAGHRGRLRRGDAARGDWKHSRTEVKVRLRTKV